MYVQVWGCTRADGLRIPGESLHMQASRRIWTACQKKMWKIAEFHLDRISSWKKEDVSGETWPRAIPASRILH